MNKNDGMLIVGVVIVSVVIISLFYLSEKNVPKVAKVYSDKNLILTINLNTKEKKDYIVTGVNGDVVITALNGKVKVEKENSPLNLCSKQGWIEKTYESIICLPNKIVVEIEAENDIDAVVR